MATPLETPAPEGAGVVCFGESCGGYTGGLDQLPFREIWAYDFEYSGNADFDGEEWQDNGNPPVPLCLVAWELKSGRKVKLWRNEFGSTPPYPTGKSVVFVSYNANAEAQCHLPLGWPLPARTLDLCTEFRAHTNGRFDTPKNKRITDALLYYRLETIGAVEKKLWTNRIHEGDPFSAADKAATTAKATFAR